MALPQARHGPWREPTRCSTRPWRGERLAIITNGGGAGVLAGDALELGSSRLATLREETIALLGKQLPFTWSRGNPIDIIGDAPVSRYQHALQVLLAAPEVDGRLFMHAPSAIVAASEIALSCLPRMQTADKPVLTCWLGGATVAAASQATAQAGVATYGTPERAVAAWL